MQHPTPDSPRVHRSRIDSSGRVLIPAALRSGLYVSEGDAILFVERKEGIELRTGRQAARAAQEFFCGLVDSDVLMSEELLAERQADAERS